jgi:hypothetical protein
LSLCIAFDGIFVFVVYGIEFDNGHQSSTHVQICRY